jgi:hypothetical protein
MGPVRAPINALRNNARILCRCRIGAVAANARIGAAGKNSARAFGPEFEYPELPPLNLKHAA